MKYPIPSSLLICAIATAAHSQQVLTGSLEPPSGTGQCVDSEPLGDGFGWNGVCSCTLEPVSGFGSTLSIDGELAAIGSSQSPNGCNGSGTIYIYQLDDTGIWTERQELIASSRQVNDGFPKQVSVSNDTVVANTFGGGPSIVTVFTRRDGHWIESQQLTFDYHYVAFSLDANTLAIATAVDQLRFYSRRDDAIWQADQDVVHTGYISSFDMSGDTLAIVSRDTDSLTIYQRRDGSWQPQAQFNLPEVGWISDNAISVTDSAVIYTPVQRVAPFVYTFERDENGGWIQTDGFTMPEVNPQAAFGPIQHYPDVYLAPDGERVLYMRDNYFADPGC